MITFAQLKRDLQVGTRVTLIKCFHPQQGVDKTHPALGRVRQIILKQSNAIKFDDGSWLGLGSTGEKASNFEYDGEVFTFRDEWIVLTYRIERNQNDKN